MRAEPIIALVISCALGAAGGGLVGYTVGYGKGYTTAKDEIMGQMDGFRNLGQDIWRNPKPQVPQNLPWPQDK
tara:strand:+ start:230 stop:448 length:219 start_codon:yes stop_codon:yes gene_type:complete